MSPARRSVNPQQEALDLGLPEPAPEKTKPINTKPAKVEVAQGEPVDSAVSSIPVPVLRPELIMGKRRAATER